MIIVKLDRDQSWSIKKYFFVYLEQVCEMKVNQEHNQSEKMRLLIVQDLFEQVKKLVDKKLMTAANKFTYKFTDSQGIMLYILLKDYPISEREVYLIMLRQLLIDIIYKSLADKVSMQKVA